MNRDGLYGMPPFDTFGSGKTLAKGKIDLVLYTLQYILKYLPGCVVQAGSLETRNNMQRDNLVENVYAVHFYS